MGGFVWLRSRLVWLSRGSSKESAAGEEEAEYENHGGGSAHEGGAENPEHPQYKTDQTAFRVPVKVRMGLITAVMGKEVRPEMVYTFDRYFLMDI